MGELRKRGVSVFGFFSIGFGSIVGVGWAVSINRWMIGCGGPVPAALGYITALILMIPIALCYCELVSMLPVAGGGMAFAYKAFGEKMSFISGWASFGAFVTIVPWEAIYVTDILNVLFPVLKSGIPLYTLAGTDIYLSNVIIGLIFSFLIFFLNKKGMGASVVLQKWLCIILIFSGVLAMVLSLIKFNPKNLIGINSRTFYENVGVGFHNNLFGGILGIMINAPFFLSGFETIPQVVEEAGSKVTSVGKTVVASVGLACLFYGLLLLCLGGAMPWQEFCRIPSPSGCEIFKRIYPETIGNVLYCIMLFGILAGLFTTWNGFFMASAFLLMSMGRVCVIPNVLAKQNKKHIPINALFVVFIFSCCGPFLGLGLIDSLTSFSGAAYMLTWMITSFSLIKLRKSAPDMTRPFKIPGGVATAWFSGIISAVIFALMFIFNNPVFMGKLPVILFLCWMVVGCIFFRANIRERKNIPRELRSAVLFSKIPRQPAENPKG